MLFVWLSARVPHAETTKVFCVYDLYWCPWQGENLGGFAGMASRGWRGVFAALPSPSLRLAGLPALAAQHEAGI